MAEMLYVGTHPPVEWLHGGRTYQVSPAKDLPGKVMVHDVDDRGAQRSCIADITDFWSPDDLGRFRVARKLQHRGRVIIYWPEAPAWFARLPRHFIIAVNDEKGTVSDVLYEESASDTAIETAVRAWVDRNIPFP